ncbi:hypothetical protein [Streptomyces sp. NBC_00503]|uniref:hypothetical protein n=1 Tax=Streptomyces sp. NBC_00503 TaxID=2903659 RepID=UPI002E805754|nr:hypothetical protein [Streptomyces sp. NBC_00503]WUD79741.1 hypothetical protein OG490_03635 [Streptomyces sp. NBC_00503]
MPTGAPDVQDQVHQGGDEHHDADDQQVEQPFGVFDWQDIARPDPRALLHQRPAVVDLDRLGPTIAPFNGTPIAALALILSG